MWFKGSIHMHTSEGDGDLSKEEIFNWYQSKGFSFIAFTDHNVITNYYKKLNGFLVIQNSIEFGQFETDLHISGIGLSTDKLSNNILSFQEKIDYILNNGGIAIINHPNWKWLSCSFGMLDSLKRYTGIEIFNTLMTHEIGSSYALEKWDYILTKGIKAWGFAVDDLHSSSEELMGKGWIMVKADILNREEILKSICAGNFYSSNGGILNEILFDKNNLTINSINGEEIVFIADNGEIINSVNSRMANQKIGGKYKYIRAEIRSKDGIAFTQPFFNQG